MTDHVPASLHFSSMTYTLGSRTILDNISGSVKPGQVMAIMGASGAGKSTFLDLLARERKRGNVSGVTLVNGRVNFSCLSSLGLFANEWILFMKERYVTGGTPFYSPSYPCTD